MSTIQSYWSEFSGNFLSVVSNITFSDVLDWLVVAFLIYHGIRLVRETRAMQLVNGIAAILLVYFFANQLGMITLTFVMDSVVRSGMVLLAVLFQPELRRALEQVGRNKIISGIGRIGAPSASQRRESMQEFTKTVCDSCHALSESKTGALIVIEREIKLGDVIKTGTVIDASPSAELIGNIFFANSPLHDGAMVIRDRRLLAAGCYLPLSANTEIGRELGTRHRAALGMSEVSDAIVVVVSEETGAISVALDSRLQRKLSVQNLGKLLGAKLDPDPAEPSPRRFAFWRAKK